MATNDIPEWAQIIINCHKAVAGDNVSHCKRLRSDRYFCWQEDGVDQDGFADNEHDAGAVSGSTDLFTKQEFDPWRNLIEVQFTLSQRIVWVKTGTTYEPNTGFFHHSWDWTVY